MMGMTEVKKPIKISFVSQREIVEKNRIHRENTLRDIVDNTRTHSEHVLRILDEIFAAQKEAAVSSTETHKNNI
ncbi:hypothetical protein [Paenibacillus sp. IITD108]|uniref:hypothetical protein n=1 Tax=Paenibacillus sp. IITD108 TaxID=3116649 RepID=UPI002F3F164F